MNAFNSKIGGTQRSCHSSIQQRGLTLIELMISIVLGLVLIVGVLSIFVSTNQTAKLNDNLMRVQENARGTFDLMARDIREAGQNPCGARKNVANLLRSSGTIPVWSAWHLGTLRGYDNTQDEPGIKAFGTSTNARVSGTDAVLVIKADSDEKNVASHDTGTTTFTLNGGSSFQELDIAFVCDALSAAIFQINDISPDSGADKGKNLDHQQDVSNINCGDFLGPPATPSDCPVASKTFSIQANTPEIKVAPLAASFWYVGINGNGGRSLYRSKISRFTSGGATSIVMSPEEIVPDVHDLQITYLTRDGTTGTLSNNWVSATSITDWKDDSDSTSVASAPRVVAVKLDLTLQTVEKVGTNQAVIQRHLIYVSSLRNREVFVAP